MKINDKYTSNIFYTQKWNGITVLTYSRQGLTKLSKIIFLVPLFANIDQYAQINLPLFLTNHVDRKKFNISP